jgi:hypothetical protein
VTLADPIITQYSLFVVLISLFQSRCWDAFLPHCCDIVIFSEHLNFNQLKIGYRPGEKFSLRDFHHAVNNIPLDGFLHDQHGGPPPTGGNGNCYGSIIFQFFAWWVQDQNKLKSAKYCEYVWILTGDWSSDWNLPYSISHVQMYHWRTFLAIEPSILGLLMTFPRKWLLYVYLHKTQKLSEDLLWY